MNGGRDWEFRATDVTLRRQPCYRRFDLPLYHADPFDRQIIAQALA